MALGIPFIFIFENQFIGSANNELAFCFVFLICVLHIVFTGFSARLSYAGYLTKCFNSLFTPGGVVIGVFTYPITSLLHDVAGIVIYAIAFLIF